MPDINLSCQRRLASLLYIILDASLRCMTLALSSPSLADTGVIHPTDDITVQNSIDNDSHLL